MPTATNTAAAIVTKTSGHKYLPWMVRYTWVSTRTAITDATVLVTGRTSGTMEFATKRDGVAWVNSHLANGARIDGDTLHT